MENVELIILGLKIVTLIILGVGVYYLFAYIDRLHVVQSGLHKMYSGLRDLARNREAEEDAYRELYGKHLRENWVTRFDSLLHYSGLFRKYKFLSTEIVIILMVLILGVVFFGSFVIFDGLNGWYYILVAELVTYLIIMSWLNNMRMKEYRKCGKQMLSFVNIVSNYASTTDDLINILERAAYGLDEPLRTVINEAYIKARSTGNTSEALKQLEYSLEYPFFKTVIRNLELASRNEANYSVIVNECREMLQNNLENEKELEIIYRNGRIKLVGTVAAGMGCIFILATGILGMDVLELINSMRSSVIGTLIMVYAIVVSFLGLYHAFIDGEGR